MENNKFSHTLLKLRHHPSSPALGHQHSLVSGIECRQECMLLASSSQTFGFGLSYTTGFPGYSVCRWQVVGFLCLPNNVSQFLCCIFSYIYMYKYPNVSVSLETLTHHPGSLSFAPAPQICQFIQVGPWHSLRTCLRPQPFDLKQDSPMPTASSRLQPLAKACSGPSWTRIPTTDPALAGHLVVCFICLTHSGGTLLF